MATYVALLHSIVLYEGRRVVMSELRAMAETLGFSEVRTLVSTGNLVFDTEKQPLSEIERQLEAAFIQTFGKPVDIIARDAESWRRLAAGNPFHEGEGSEVAVRIMRQALDASIVDVLAKRCIGTERMAAVGGDLWIDFGTSASETKLLPALTTKRLGAGTLRNWNTVRGIVELLDR
jgi:uncharacterized protein (DUF1697 family)